MQAEGTLLVVDDEAVVCESCNRIFAESPYRVESTQDAYEGLRRAVGGSYEAILLDMKMPVLEGTEFLERLRAVDSAVPVIIITGYSSSESAETAKRLGASDYIPKPFSPDELRGAVDRVVTARTRRRTVDGAFAAYPDSETDKAIGEKPAKKQRKLDLVIEVPIQSEFSFLDNAWMRRESDGSVRTGAFLTLGQGQSITGVRLPKEGERVWRGLPLAVLELEGGTREVIPSPVSGFVDEVNDVLREQSDWAWKYPCQKGWIARINPCLGSPKGEPRTVILATQSEEKVRSVRADLGYLGCNLVPARSLETIRIELIRSPKAVVMIDAASFESAGPVLAARIRESNPATRVIVAADENAAHETEYRAASVFYYAVEAFADHEIIDILTSAFRRAPMSPPFRARHSSPLPQQVSKVRIQNHNGETVTLMTAYHHLNRTEGVGLWLLDRLNGLGLPVEVEHGRSGELVAELAREIEASDRVVLLSLEDRGTIAGNLVEMRAEDACQGLAAEFEKLTYLAVQSREEVPEELSFDDRTERYLAENLIDVLAG